MTNLQLRGVEKSYDKTQVIHGVDLDINSGEFIVFVGPSGCGKSTLLRMIAGLEDISAGNIVIGDEIVNDVVAAERGVAMVFQSYALYPHMTVFDNMAFGLRQAKTPKDEIKKRVDDAAEILQITPYLDRLPKHLSGGQRQRVAIGRAIVRNPRVFLFDEPLSNLDAALRVQTRLEIAKLHSQLSATMIYVTHDQVEAMTLADKIVVLNSGIIEQVGSPVELYNNPANLFVAEFIGSPKMNILSASSLVRPMPKNTVYFGVRPEHLCACGKAKASIKGRIRHLEHLGEYILAYITCDDGQELTAKLPEDDSIANGKTVYLDADQDKWHYFDADGLSLTGKVSP